MIPFTNIRYCCVIVMCAVWFMAQGGSKTVKLTSATDDKITIAYDITHQDNNVVISFGYVNDLKLGKKNKASYYKAQDQGRVKVVFMDDLNLDENTQVKSENNIRWTPFTTPSGWEYHRQGNIGPVFPLNDMYVQPKIAFSGNRDKQKLVIPVYLAYTTEKKEKNIIGKTKKIITTYHLFSEFDPLVIELSTPRPVVTRSNDASPSEQKSQTISLKNEIEEIEIANSINDNVLPEVNLPQDASQDSPEGGGGGSSGKQVDPKNDDNVRQKLQELKIRLDSCKKTPEVDVIEIEYNGLKEAYASEVSPDVKREIIDFHTLINQKRDIIKPSEIKKTWIIRILAVLGAILGALGFHKLQSIRNAKNLKGLEDMQQKMVRRAENEAKRRAQSVARNKAHQMVGKARQKGRNAVRSGVTDLGDRVKGRNAGSKGSDIPTIGSENATTRPTAQRQPATGTKPKIGRPKPGKNGKISI